MGKELYVRGFWREDYLRFDAAGKLLTQSNVASFTICGMDVQKITLKKGVLTLQGPRQGLEFDPAPHRVSLKRQMEIKIEAPADGDFTKLLDGVFVEGLDTLKPMLPIYWRALASRDFAPYAPVKGSHDTTEHVEKFNGIDVKTGPDIKPPLVAKSEWPSLIDEAHMLHYKADVVIEIIVGPDGKPLESHIAKAAGLGVDEQVLYVIRHFTWKPATEHGTPVAVQIFSEFTVTPSD